MKFSIITICFNPGAMVQSAVASVLAQGYQDIEYIIVDGGSTDGTVEWLEGVAKESAQVRLISEPDDGLYDALNKGVRLATGDVIGFVHADDFLAHADVLDHIAARFDDTGVEALYGDLQYVAEKSGSQEVGESGSLNASLQDCETSRLPHFSVVRHWVSGEYDRKKLKWGWMPPHPALYLHRNVYDRVKLAEGEYFDTSFSCAADYDLMMRVLSKLNVCPAYLPEVVVRMRTGGVSNRSLKHILRKSWEDWRAIRRNNIGHLHTLVWKNLSKLSQFFS